MSETESYTLSVEVCQEIDHWLAKFPADKRQSAVLQALRIVQDKEGWLSQAMMRAIADYLGIPAIAVFEVATFYSMYHLKPAGKHKIYVCTNISCLLRDCDKVVSHLKQKLKIQFGEITDDGQVSLHEVECLAACRGAPAIQVDKDYYENVTPEKIDEIIANLE